MTVRVVHVARYFHPHVGGTEQVIASLARELARDGVQSTVVVSDLDRGGAGPPPEIPVFVVPVAGPARFPVPRGRLATLARVVRDADVVHLHDVRFLFEFTAVLRRRPVVLSTHGLVFHTDAAAGTKDLVWRWWIAPRLRRLDRVVAVSERDAALCRAAGVDDLVVIPNGVDVGAFDAVPDRRREAVRELLYFGRVAPEKNLASLVGLLHARPSWRLTIAGTGETGAVDRTREAFAGVAGRVVFAGAVDATALRGLLYDADCVVLPSPAESFGLTLVEAMAAGVPVVAADTAAYRETAGATDVGLVPFDRPADVGATIERTVTGWDAARARARARDFSWRAAGAAYAKVYADIRERRR